MDDALQYVYSLERFGMKPGTDRVRQILDALGNPEAAFQSIHISGTSGKGSTAAFIDSILRQTDLTIGLYTSPHIHAFNERVRVNGKNISDAELASCVKVIREVVEEHGIEATFFEFTTALAFLYFAQQEVDVAVVEVGMGGANDATNVMSPICSVITNIGLDHVAILGPTKKDIAREKSGVIKSGARFVTSERDARILRILQKRCDEVGTLMSQVDEDIRIQPVSSSLSGQRARVHGVWDGYLDIPLLGMHQLTNVATALVVMHQIKESGIDVSWDQIARGIEVTRWEGRIDIVSTSPLVIADGAHNADGAVALHSFVKTLPRRDVLVLGIKKGNDIDGIASNIAPLFERVVITQGNFQPEDIGIVADRVRSYAPRVYEAVNVRDALKEAMTGLDSHGVVLIAGSLYLVADALDILRS